MGWRHPEKGVPLNQGKNQEVGSKCRVGCQVSNEIPQRNFFLEEAVTSLSFLSVFIYF